MAFIILIDTTCDFYNRALEKKIFRNFIHFEFVKLGDLNIADYGRCVLDYNYSRFSHANSKKGDLFTELVIYLPLYELYRTI